MLARLGGSSSGLMQSGGGKEDKSRASMEDARLPPPNAAQAMLDKRKDSVMMLKCVAISFFCRQDLKIKMAILPGACLLSDDPPKCLTSKVAAAAGSIPTSKASTPACSRTTTVEPLSSACDA